jgi:hypothetical protein
LRKKDVKYYRNVERKGVRNRKMKGRKSRD